MDQESEYYSSARSPTRMQWKYYSRLWSHLKALLILEKSAFKLCSGYQNLVPCDLLDWAPQFLACGLQRPLSVPWHMSLPNMVILLYQNRQEKIFSSKIGIIALHRVTMEVISHHLCHNLLVRSKSHALTTLKRRELHKDWNTTGWRSWTPF